MSDIKIRVAVSNLQIAASNYETTRRGDPERYDVACANLLRDARAFVDAERSSVEAPATFAATASAEAWQHVRSLLKLLDEIGGWRTREQQDLVREVKRAAEAAEVER